MNGGNSKQGCSEHLFFSQEELLIIHYLCLAIKGNQGITSNVMTFTQCHVTVCK